jgi:hypothetical protein
VNYLIREKGDYEIIPKEYTISLNKYLELDSSFNVKFEKWFETKYDKRISGIEDVRIFYDVDTNGIKFIGTTLQNSKIGLSVGNYDYSTEQLQGNEIAQSFLKTDCEKNWVFVNYKGSPHIIYSWRPLRICKIAGENEGNGELVVIETKQMPLLFSHVRGSTCGFEYVRECDSKKEIWFVTHLVSYETPRHYYHMIVVFDESLNLLRYSAPFKFEGCPIEFCLSIVVDNHHVLMNYSTWDRTTRIAGYDKHYIDTEILRFTPS